MIRFLFIDVTRLIDFEFGRQDVTKAMIADGAL